MEISSGPLGGPISGPLSGQLLKVRGGNKKSSVKRIPVMMGELTGWQICGVEIHQGQQGYWAKVSHADLVMKGGLTFAGGGVFMNRPRKMISGRKIRQLMNVVRNIRVNSCNMEIPVG